MLSVDLSAIPVRDRRRCCVARRTPRRGTCPWRRAPSFAAELVIAAVVVRHKRSNRSAVHFKPDAELLGGMQQRHVFGIGPAFMPERAADLPVEDMPTLRLATPRISTSVSFHAERALASSSSCSGRSPSRTRRSPNAAPSRSTPQGGYGPVAAGDVAALAKASATLCPDRRRDSERDIARIGRLKLWRRGRAQAANRSPW